MVPGGGTAPVPLSPGVFVVSSGDEPLFTSGMADMMAGLEHIAEDGNPLQLGAAVAARTGLVTPLAPGVAVVHSHQAMLFTAGQPDAGLGLEALAEDASPGALAANLDGAPRRAQRHGVRHAGRRVHGAAPSSPATPSP